VSDALAGSLPEVDGDELARAARYAVLGDGHRWRALATIASCGIFRRDALALAMPAACAMELVHAATLVLDDLPSMDAAALRRGKPCVHRVFTPWVVDMLPAYLVNRSYRILLHNPLASEDRLARTAAMLSRAGDLLACGQAMDVTRAAGASEPALLECYAKKSGALFAASLAAGALLAGATPRDVDLLHDAGMKLGIVYQLVDDLGDTADDAPASGPCTAVRLFGRAGATERVRRLATDLHAGLASFGEEAAPLRWLAEQACGGAPAG
jgi:geranylgeranyl diphosphate synthase type II